MFYSVAYIRLLGFGIHFQRMLFLVLLVLYLTVVETKLLYLPPFYDWSSIHNYIKRQEVRVFHIVNQQAYRRQKLFHSNFASCVQTRRNTTVSPGYHSTLYLIRG